jgi:tetratricopeptide (TPR) repeat protein
MLTGSSLPGPANEAESIAEATRLLQQGEPLLAYNAADAGLQRWPDHPRLRQLLALALARSGDTARANGILRELVAQGSADSETLGALARTHKDLGLSAKDTESAAGHLEAAFQIYERAYQMSRNCGAASDAYYTGINAATVAVLCDKVDVARAIATEVTRICESSGEGVDGAEAEYWRQATLGEAALILGDAPSARKHYTAASHRAAGRFGDLSSTRKQARLLAARLAIDDTWLTETLRIPPVLVYTGHMIDQDGRRPARFPPDLEFSVMQALRQTLADMRPVAAYGSAACGTDILCLEVVHELGGELHIVLPFPAAEFRRTSVDVAPGSWGQRFERLLAAASSVTIASDHRASGSTATYEYANLLAMGLGQLRAQLLDTSLRGLAVWDGTSSGAHGGSASVVLEWKQRGMAVQQIPPANLNPVAALPAAGDDPDEVAAPYATGAAHLIKALLFADVVGYSKLNEDQIPIYVTSFLGAVAELNRRTGHRCEHIETAGDGLYMVFAETAAAAHYALELSELVGSTDWTAHGLPASFNLRIALHCGPIYSGWEPITGRPLFTGPHTSRAARIEPITPPGQVYATSAFAAVAAARDVDKIAMRYVGRLPLAKSSGTLALYHLQRGS